MLGCLSGALAVVLELLGVRLRWGIFPAVLIAVGVAVVFVLTVAKQAADRVFDLEDEAAQREGEPNLAQRVMRLETDFQRFTAPGQPSIQLGQPENTASSEPPPTRTDPDEELE